MLPTSYLLHTHVDINFVTQILNFGIHNIIQMGDQVGLGQEYVM